VTSIPSCFISVTIVREPATDTVASAAPFTTNCGMCFICATVAGRPTPENAAAAAHTSGYFAARCQVPMAPIE
jgi:hypothetical protein